jgi:hypothetical protein
MDERLIWLLPDDGETGLLRVQTLAVQQNTGKLIRLRKRQLLGV